MRNDAYEEVTVTEGSVDNVGTLIALTNIVHGWHVAAFPALFRNDAEQALADYFTKSLQNPEHYHYLAYTGTDVVGFTQAELHTSAGSPFRKPSRLLFINIIVVRPERQGKGIGQHLVSRIQQLAEEQHVSRIELNHWEGNDSASHFFRKLGFRPYRHYLYRESDKSDEE